MRQLWYNSYDSYDKVVVNAWQRCGLSGILDSKIDHFGGSLPAIFSQQKTEMSRIFHQKLTVKPVALDWILRMRLIQHDVQWLDIPVIHRWHQIRHMEETL